MEKNLAIVEIWEPGNPPMLRSFQTEHDDAKAIIAAGPIMPDEIPLVSAVLLVTVVDGRAQVQTKVLG